MNAVSRSIAHILVLILFLPVVALAEETFVRNEAPEFPEPQAERALVYFVGPPSSA